jgi:zinc protease
MKKIIKIFLILTFIIISKSIAISDNLPQNAENKKYEEGKVYRHTLSNGMTVLTMERHNVPYIYHQLTYKVGSVNEPPGLTGISHVVEHMMFKGTKKYSKGEISKIISQNSGVFNAFTTADMTSYYIYLPKDKIEIAFDIESDRMQNSTFDSTEFTREIEVILQERRTRTESNPNGIFYENLNALVFTLHPYRNPTIGWQNDLKKMTYKDAFNFYKTYYTPNNSILVLVGDFETDEIIKLAEKYYGKIPPGPQLPEPEFYEPEQKVKKSFTLVHSDIQSPTLSIVFKTPSFRDDDGPALYLLGKILCEKSRGSRLYKRLVEDEKLALSVGGGLSMMKYAGLFYINVVLNPDSSTDRVEQIIWDEIEKLKKEGPSEKELQKVKNRFKFTQTTEYIKNADIGMRISTWECYYGWDYYDVFYNKVLNVSADDIKKVANNFLIPETSTLSWRIPKEKKNVTISEDEEESEEKTEPVKLFENDDFSRFYLKENELIEPCKELLNIPRPKPITPLIKKHKLENGITLYTIENKLVPTILVYGIINTGIITEEIYEGKNGLSNVLADVLNRGPANLTYDEYVDKLSFYPISISIRGNYRGFTFEGYSLTENSNEMLKTLVDILTNPRLDTTEIKLIKDKHRALASRRFKSTKVIAFYYMFDNIFKNHEYSKNKITTESINKITTDDVIKAYKKYINPQQTTIIVVGSLKHDELFNLVKYYFSSWKSKENLSTSKGVSKVEPLNDREIKAFSDNEYTECTINIGFSPYNDIKFEEIETAKILNYILAQSALTSRIGVELRDKQGLIYGIRSQLWYTRDRIGYWKFNIKTAPQNVTKVIEGIFKEIQKLISEGITDEEFTNAKQRMLGLLPLYTETPYDVASIVAESIIYKLPLDNFDTKYDRIKSITKDDIIKVAEKYLTLDKYIIVVDGPITDEDINKLKQKFLAQTDETKLEVKELTQYHEVIYKLWHIAYLNKDINMIIKLYDDLKDGADKVANAKLPGILRDKEKIWKENAEKLLLSINNLKNAIDKKDTTEILKSAETIHAMYETLTKVIKPPIKEVDDFHQTLYVLYHYYVPENNIEKIKTLIPELLQKVKNLKNASLPDKLKQKEEKFKTIVLELDKEVLNFISAVENNKDKTSIKNAMEKVHQKYQALEKLFE